MICASKEMKLFPGQFNRDHRDFREQAKKRPARGLREFAEQEVVIPEGEYEGLLYRAHRQPFSSLFFDEVDSGRWRTFASTGCVQSGKTLCTVVVPLLWHLFELKQTVVFGLPTMDIAEDKWVNEVLPAINAQAKFRELLPRSGKGSKGGAFDSIKFRHGPVLKFMTAGGGDERRSGFTAPVLVITEADKMDDASESSREASPINQMIARTAAIGDRARIYMECTVSIPEGEIWSQYQNGSQSRIVAKCLECHAWVSPEREHFRGFQDAETEKEAEQDSSFYCPACGIAIDDERRWRMCVDSRVVHRGQEVGTDGGTIGKLPSTYTLGFRWGAFWNRFWSSGYLGICEWKALRDSDQDNAERESCQFRWCQPYVSPDIDTMKVDFERTRRKTRQWTKGVIPDDTEYLTCGVDLGKRLIHWTAIAWLKGGSSHIVDYGRMDVASDDLGTEPALLLALRDLRDFFEIGWQETETKARQPDQVWMDANWKPDPVYEFLRDVDTENGVYFPTFGRGTRHKERKYSQPSKTGATTKELGEHFHIDYQPSRETHLVSVDVDYWKMRVHQLLILKEDAQCTMTIFHAAPTEHISFVKHIKAEEYVERFEEGKGTVRIWEQIHSNNHWLDSTALACASASRAGYRYIAEKLVESVPFSAPVKREESEPYLITDR